jgi:hypothetical protein
MNPNFGTSNNVFLIETAKQLLTKAETDGDFTFREFKDYFSKYYAKTLHQNYYFYNPDKDGTPTFENIDDTALNYVIKSIAKKGIYKTSGIVKAEFSIKDWFISDYSCQVSIGLDPLQPRIYKCPKQNIDYINLCRGFKHINRKPYESFPNHIKEGVQKILDHLKNVWNSGDEVGYEFTMNWFAFSLTGHKMHSALFLKSGEGTGKSLIVNFLINKVIGQYLGYSTSKADQITKFNAQLIGRIFLCLEELPTESKGAWFSLSDILKDLITGSKHDIEKKFHDMMTVENLISVIIITNNENVLKLGNAIRRYFILDVSHKYVDNVDYFNNLAEVCEGTNSDLIGEAFFNMMWERYEKCIADGSFSVDAKPPMTEGKIVAKDGALSSVHKFFKHRYLCNNMDVQLTSLKDMMAEHNDYCLKTNLKPFESAGKFKQQINQDLSCIDIKDKHVGKVRCLHILPISHADLMNFYVKKGFWFDGADVVEKINNDTDDDPLEYGIEKDKSNDELLKQIQELKRQLDEANKKIALYESEQTVKVEIKKKPKKNVVYDFEDDVVKKPIEKPIKQKKIKKEVVEEVISDNELDEKPIEDNDIDEDFVLDLNDDFLDDMKKKK